MPIRVGIVNDMKLAAEVLRKVVATDPALAVSWIARDGEEAVALCANDLPDLVLMDLVMPKVNGVEATRRIMASTPCPILLVTATVSGNLDLVYDAMGAGAVDVTTTPVVGDQRGLDSGEELRRKIHAVCRVSSPVRAHAAGELPTDAPDAMASGGRLQSAQLASRVPPALTASALDRLQQSHPATSPPLRFGAARVLPPLLAIGASTGGPAALAEVLGALPGDFPAAVAIVQHIDREFVGGLATWLAGSSALPVALARGGEPLQAGRVLIAEAGHHLVLDALGRLQYTSEPRDALHCPSVDVFFSSVAEHAPSRSCGVLLTGMGRDGASGLLAMRRAGFHTVAQDQASSVVYGMPAAAAALGAARQVLPLRGIAPHLKSVFKEAVTP